MDTQQATRAELDSDRKRGERRCRERRFEWDPYLPQAYRAATRGDSINTLYKPFLNRNIMETYRSISLEKCQAGLTGEIQRESDEKLD